MFHHSSELLDMLTYQRPHTSATVRAFEDKYIASLPDVVADAFGNHVVHVGTSDVLWSCHTDTVHRQAGRQTVHVSADGLVTLSKRSLTTGANCLGADDTVGVFLMRQMIQAGVPGHYVFHHGEERGGIGSRALSRQAPPWLASCKYAIAFDRRSTGDVITHQQCMRTASNVFAASLSDILNTGDAMRYRPDDGGIYTDTAEYAEQIPECTNISVGYAFEHTTREQVDLAHVGRLLAVLLTFDESGLVCARDPHVYESEYAYGGWRLSDEDVPADEAMPKDADGLCTCQWCGLAYAENESNAIEQDAFCDDDCELRYYMDLADRRKARQTARDYFLSDDYAEVQRHLRGKT